MSTVHEFIKDLETFNRHTINVNRVKVCNTVIPRFHKFLFNKNNNNTIDKEIARLYKETQTFLKNNSNIIFTQADKENVTMAINKDYINKVEELLNDKNTYTIEKKNPALSIKRKLNVLLKSIKKNTSLRKHIFHYIPVYSSLPKAYALPKIHKLNVPFRIIISSIYTALHTLWPILYIILSLKV